MEFSKRFKVEEVWPAELIAKMPEVKGKTLFDVLYANGQVNQFPKEQSKGMLNDEAEHFGFYVQKGLFEEYATFGRGHGHDLAPFDQYHEARGLRWPVVDGKETLWRYREGFDPYVKAGEECASMASPMARRSSSPCRSSPPPSRPIKSTTCGSPPVACWSTGTPAP